jgi:biopolymer transport protein ExbD
MSVKIDRGKAAGLINMTPMIDVVFQLLLFFLVASRFADEERYMKMVLPQASEARPVSATTDAYTINVDHQGRFFVGGQALSRAGLQQALVQASANNPGRQRVVIRADKRCPFEYVVVVMDACNRAGLRNYQCVIAPESRRAAP